MHFWPNARPSTTVQDSYATLCHNVPVPPLALCHRITLKDDQITTLCIQWTTSSVTKVRNSFAHTQICQRMLTVQNSGAEILNSLKLPWDTQVNGQFTTDSQVCKRTSDGDPRTGMFQSKRRLSRGILPVV